MYVLCCLHAFPVFPNNNVYTKSTCIQAAELRKKFLEKKEAFVVSSKEKLYAAISVSDDFESTVDSNRMHSLLQWLDLSGYTEDLISIIMSDLRQKLSEWSEQLRSIKYGYR